MASKRTLEERINEKNERLQKAKEKAKQYEAQKRQLEKLQKAADRKKRARRLIEIGGTVESVLGREFKEGDTVRLKIFLELQEERGRFFSSAMQRPLPAKTAALPETETILPESDVPEESETAPQAAPETGNYYINIKV